MLQNYDEACADYTRAIQLDPAHAVAHTNRGNTYVNLHRYEEALEDFNTAICLDPTDALAYRNIGTVLYNRGALQEALPYLEKAAQLGDQAGTQYAEQVRRELGIVSDSQVNPAQLAFEASQHADSLDDMRGAVARFPFMTNFDFIAAIEQTIVQQVPPEHRPAFKQRLAWLRQIADEQK